MTSHVEVAQVPELWLPAAGRKLIRGLLVILALAFCGEFVLTLMGWRNRSVPVLLRERADKVEESGKRLAFHPTRLFTTAPNHRSNSDSAGRAPTGAWPFRGRPFEPRPRELPTVMVLGDSGVHGVHLFEADTLPTSIARELERLGLPPESVAVLNLGVPGYTTLQIERLYEQEVSGRDLPVALVVSTAMWNDRAPAPSPVQQGDLLEAADPSFLRRVFAGWTARFQWLGWGGNPLRTPASPEELEEAWRRGEAMYGPLVPREDAGAAIRRIVDDASARGVEVVSLIPAHPLESLTGQPGRGEDVDALRSALNGAEATVVDGPALLASSGLRDGEAFLDQVHPSGRWNHLLARAIASELAPALKAAVEAVSDADGELAIQSVSPVTISPLGDELLVLKLTGLGKGELPAVMVGGQLLFDLRREDVGGETVLSGMTGADSPGVYDVLVQSEDGCSRLPRAVTRERPRLQYVPGSDSDFPRVILLSRPGDRIAALWGGKRSQDGESWSLEGQIDLAPGAIQLELDGAACDASGRSETKLQVGPEWPTQDLVLQALVLRRGHEYEPGSGVASDSVGVRAAPPPAVPVAPSEEDSDASSDGNED